VLSSIVCVFVFFLCDGCVIVLESCVASPCVVAAPIIALIDILFESRPNVIVWVLHSLFVELHLRMAAEFKAPEVIRPIKVCT
jgi:hypothetical protein